MYFQLLNYLDKCTAVNLTAPNNIKNCFNIEDIISQNLEESYYHQDPQEIMALLISKIEQLTTTIEDQPNQNELHKNNNNHIRQWELEN